MNVWFSDGFSISCGGETIGSSDEIIEMACASEIKEFMYNVWRDKFDAGEEPRRYMNAACYPVHDINGITLYTAPVAPRERVSSYGIDTEELELDFDLRFFFLDKSGNIVDDFEGNKTRVRPVTTDLESFAHIFGRYFDNVHYHPQVQRSYSM